MSRRAPLQEVTRSEYTDRITEIVKSINKQKFEISKVLIDTRVLQKDINTLGDKLSRTFAVTDELIFKVGGATGATGRQPVALMACVQSICAVAPAFSSIFFSLSLRLVAGRQEG